MEVQKSENAAKKTFEINITLDSGDVVKGEAGKTLPFDIAKGISKTLQKEAIIARVKYTGTREGPIIAAAMDEEGMTETSTADGELWDLGRPLEGDCTIRFYTFSDDDGKMVFWHSTAHVLGECLEQEYGSQLCHGPPIVLGPKGSFFYDVYMGENTFSPDDYKVIEKNATAIIKDRQKFERLVMTKEQLLNMFEDNPFKCHTISTKVPDGGYSTVYRCGPLIDLCLGPHIPDTSRIKGFGIRGHSATYFGGKEDNDSLQRVYGVAFPEKKQMKDWEAQMKLLEEYDHRKVGREQELFFFHELSPGSAMFLPHGARIYNKLCDFIKEQYWARQYTEVYSPNIYNVKLWEQSGHWEHYEENMFSFHDSDGLQFALKPMNCPGHCLMFDHRVRSYRELPMRFADFGTLHRNEKSGALTGLTRVRRFQQDDGHIFCRMDQVTQEVLGALEFMKYVYGIFGMTYTLDLSTRPDKACGLETPAGVARWDAAEEALKQALNSFAGEDNWRYNHGDGAFYGPKIDIKVYDIVQREHQCATIQLDFQLPISFDLKYKSGKEVTAEDKAAAENVSADSLQGNEKPLPPGYERPVIVHRAMLGSVERMIAVLTEHFQGKWPFWLSPRQVMVVPVHQDHYPYAEEVAAKLYNAGFYAEADCGEETMNKKVRNAQLSMYNFILVVGQEEIDNRSVNVRTRSNKRLGEGNTWAKGLISLDDCVKFFDEIASNHERDPNPGQEQ